MILIKIDRELLLAELVFPEYSWLFISMSQNFFRGVLKTAFNCCYIYQPTAIQKPGYFCQVRMWNRTELSYLGGLVNRGSLSFILTPAFQQLKPFKYYLGKSPKSKKFILYILQMYIVVETGDRRCSLWFSLNAGCLWVTPSAIPGLHVCSLEKYIKCTSNTLLYLAY